MNGLRRCGVYTQGILHSHKKEQNNAICSNMDGTRDSLSQKEKDKYHMISLISGIQYKAQMNLSAEKKIMDLQNRFVVAKGEGEGVRWLGSWRLIDTNYCLWNGLEMRSCCVARGTMSSHL